MGTPKIHTCAQTRKPVEERCDSGPCTSIGGGEDFGGVCVQHTVHDVYLKGSVRINFTTNVVDGE